MNKLEITREKINSLDKKIAELFEERMLLAEDVADYKKQNGLPIFDASRESVIIANNLENIKKQEIKKYYVNFQKELMKISRDYQGFLLNGMKVAYSGVEGAFAHIAAGKIFPDTQRVPFPSFTSAYEAVENGECDCAVLPMENSIAGEVGQVIDLVFGGNLYINGIYDLSVSQNLLGLKGAKVSDVKKVISHIQALEQCDKYIKEHSLSAQMCENTALAAKTVSDLGDMSVAAIASSETAELYGLEVLEKNINENHQNTTRFAVLSRSQHIKSTNKPDNHSILVFAVKNNAGSLASAIKVIGEHGFNMRMLKSRSYKGHLWQYYFYVELEGNLNTDNGKRMLNKLSPLCDKLRVVGSFYNHIDLK